MFTRDSIKASTRTIPTLSIKCYQCVQKMALVVVSSVNCNVANVAAWFAPLQHVVVLQVLKLMEFPIEGLTSASTHTTEFQEFL